MYRDLDGSYHERKDTSRHHIFARSLAHGTRMKQFINLEPLVPRILNRYHYAGSPDGLHRHVERLHPPQLFVMTQLKEVIHNLEHTGYDGLIEFAEHVEDMGLNHRNTVVRKDCARISENLQRQMPFILLGQVEIEEV